MLSQQEFEDKKWEAEVLIDSLWALTKGGIITWEYLEYEPPMLVEANELFMSQKLIARTEYEGSRFRAELSDTIDVMTGKGDVDLSVIIGDDPQNREESLDRYITFFPEDQVIQFGDLLFEQLGESTTNSPAWNGASFSIQEFTPEIVKYPLSVLGRNLFDRRQADIFHRICSEEEARNALLAEQADASCGSKSHCCCFTGHRPEKLTRPEEEVKSWLEEQIREAYNTGYTTFITGMARGVDLWAGIIVLRLKAEGMPIHLVCASPYPEFENRWAGKWQQLYHEVLSGSDAIVFISPSYSRSCFQRRNEWMVDHSSRLIAVYNGTSGGTRNTIEYARKHGCEIIL